MDPLTPNKIQRLIHLAEDRSFSIPRNQIPFDDSRKHHVPTSTTTRTSINYESSSGILDLEEVQAFGESVLDPESLSKSTGFNPGEMTGRSTEASISNSVPIGRHSLALETITNQMNKQTNEVADIMRHSIATDYSFHSKRDLTADEASLVQREAPIPIQTTQTYFADSMSINNSNLSVGAYFKNRCPEFQKILTKTDSPDRSALSAMPSITEVSTNEMSPRYKMDESLDCVPVRQSRYEKPEKNINQNIEQNPQNIPGHRNNNNDTYNKQSNVYSASENIASASKVPEKNLPKNINPICSSTFASHKNFNLSKPTDILLRNLQSSMRLVSDDTEGSAENSLSISKIADFLEKQSNIVNVSDIMQLNNQKKVLNKKQPLSELHMNNQESHNEEEKVTNLRDTRKMETASSTGTMNTVISLDKLNINQDKVPTVVVTHHNTTASDSYKKTVRSKSPSSKSQSSLSTVQENFISFKSGDSPLRDGKGEHNTSHVPSPNIEYRELDKSVDWQEVLHQKRIKQDSLVKEQWVDISMSPANGFVGVSCAVNITITTLTDSWLTAKFQFDDLPDNGKDLSIELPRLPLLLCPGKTEQFVLHITSNAEIDTTLQYTIFLKDASIDGDIEQKGTIDVNIKMPIIQAMSSDGVNKVKFPPIQENSAITKAFVLISDCPVDLQLDLNISEGDGVFAINNVQEIKKTDVNKVLMDNQASMEDQRKSKGMNKQLCRLSSGNAIRVVMKFYAPKLPQIQNCEDNIHAFYGILNVNLIGVNTVLRKVELYGAAGTAVLVIKMPSNKLHLTSEPTNVTICNAGSVPGTWYVKLASTSEFPFKVAPSKFDIRPGAMKVMTMSYKGPEDCVSETKIYLEDVITGVKTPIEISGGTDKPKSFPIKTNHNILSWVRTGRKELSLKNSSNKKVHIRCYVTGEGFSIDMPGLESRGIYCLPFGPNECRSLPLIFAPTSNLPHSATLHLAYDKNNDFCRKIKLYGCSSGEMMRWSGLVTYGDTALVRAVNREPITLELYNKSPMPAFVCANVHFNLQYASVSSTGELLGGKKIVSGRCRHVVRLSVDWSRVERRARETSTAALATVTVLTGPEITRRRILKVIRDPATNNIDTSQLDDHLKVLASQFEGEDPEIDNLLSDFNETTVSLNELIGGLHELTAQIVLPQDFADDNTIIISDDTIVEHHTLCD